MTCREKLKMEHPDFVDDGYAGGCLGCPNDYGYINNGDPCTGDFNPDDCSKCWDQEVEEE